MLSQPVHDFIEQKLCVVHVGFHNCKLFLHSRIYDSEVEHVGGLAIVLSVSLQYLPAFHLHRNFRVETA